MNRQGMGRHRARAAVLALACGCTAAAQAAGGHHGVDDASILGPRECGQENWFSRGKAGAQLLHAGLNCGVGPVELAAAYERFREPGEDKVTRWNLEAKWAHALSDSLAIGADVMPYWQSPGSRYAGTQVYGVVTWKASERLAVHADFGRDLKRGEAGQRIAGVALEYMHDKKRSFVLERYEEQRTQYVRIGPRWTIVDAVTLDLSRAQRLAGPAPSLWTVGLTFELAPD